MNINKNIAAKAALFCSAIIWGSSFLVVKDSMDVMKPHVLLALRFTLGCLLLAVVFHKRLKALNKEYFMKGGIIGFLLILAYSLQTIGIIDTTPGKNAFLTAIYCVIVPFLFWAVDKKKPDIFNVIAALIGIIGIGFVSLNGNLGIGKGDILTLISGFAYALHMVAVAKFGKEKDPILLTILQFGYAAIFSWIMVLIDNDFPRQWSANTIFGLLYLSVFATAIALLFQNIGQKYTNPAPAAIILSLESVFGVLFSVACSYEKLTLRLLLGFVLIFIAVIVSETKLSFLFGNKKAV